MTKLTANCATMKNTGLISVLRFLCIFLFPAVVSAQEMHVRGGFISDSLKIGEPTAYYLSAHYRSDLTILFPDSTFSFAPFEYQKRNYFPTATTDSVSVDSAVYYLTTFEVDRVQRLNLPVFIVQAKDCTEYRTAIDSIFITQLVARVPDSVSVEKLPLKMNTAYEKVFFQFNFWIVLIALVLLIIIGIAGWILYGEKIRRYFVTRSLKKRHEKFLETYNRILADLQRSVSTPGTESALAIWKKYMEQLEARPYTKLTTKETVMLLQDDSLRSNLRSIDASIYGHSSQVLPSLDYLRGYADQRFSQKLEEVKNGK